MGPPQEFHEVLDDGHAETGAFDAGGGRIAFSFKLLEDVRQEIRRNTDAVVGDNHAQVELVGVFPFGFFHGKPHPLAVGRVFDGVADDVGENLSQFRRVGENHVFTEVDDVRHRDVFLGGCYFKGKKYRLKEFVESAGFVLSDGFPCFNAAHLKDVVDER